MRLVDLSHIVEHGMVTYKGLPAPLICDFLTRERSRGIYAPGTEFHIGRIDMVANTGTYVDAPSHRFADGADLAGLPLERLVHLPAVVVDVRGSADRAIGAEALLPYDLSGRAVLVLTGWSRHFGTSAYGTGHPYLTGAAADHLVAERATLVGIDSLNIDDTTDARRPVHTALLAAGIPVCEHLTGLHQLPTTGSLFNAAPVMVEGMGTFPVRAWAFLPAGTAGPSTVAGRGL
jgi:kynurenine formamidase